MSKKGEKTTMNKSLKEKRLNEIIDAMSRYIGSENIEELEYAKKHINLLIKEQKQQ